MYLNIVFLPLASGLVAGFFGRKLGPYGAGILTTFCIGFTCFLSFISFYEIGLEGSPCYIDLICWIDSELFSISWGFLFDSLTSVMLIVVTFISTLVHFYSTEYMGHDPHLPRFMCYLSLFTFFMVILVTADNFVQMFVGWEGVGLCSYLLINFWFTRIQANKAAIKAMVVNRIGDLGLALGIFTIYYLFQSVNYITVFSLVPSFCDKTIVFLNIEIHCLTLIGLLLFIGAMGKSAQLGLHTWLPDAMEGPTPVSALIHAATMVTAGVFLLGRCSPIFEYAPQALIVVTVVGAMTCFFSASVGLLQNDLKRVIAYSTCSQLGYMVFACGLSNYSVGIFHLANHAFFKALLFLGAGSVIHGVSDEQDMRKMGGLKKLLPFTYSMMLIGSLSLMGLPFLTGFYSKDVILEVAYSKFSIPGHFAYWLGTIGAFLTAFYSIRLLYLTFLSECNGYRPVFLNVHDAPIRMALPLAILAIPSIFIGYLTKDMIIGFGTNFWGNALFVFPDNLTLVDSEFIPISMKLLPVIFSIIGGLSSYFFYRYKLKSLSTLKLSLIGRNLYKFLNRKWFFDKVYNEFINQPLLGFGYITTYKRIDRGIIEMVGPFGLSNLVVQSSVLLKQFQSGKTYHYILIILFSFGIFVSGFFLWDWIFNFIDSRLLIIFFLTLFLFSE
uniref:NADH-ubiquinone oxidoreductase chain 5 n=1 Tax=Chattonella marina TaxID=90936 RepID=D2Z207_9STRA|nr:NADH dehydrogenase subunit 5 [Chattonella marina]BAI70571.1 NADH dehydrogenase subunit 5 [Chattonella marina]